MAVAYSMDARFATFCIIVYQLIHLTGTFIIVNMLLKWSLFFRGVLVVSLFKCC